MFLYQYFFVVVIVMKHFGLDGLKP